MGAVKPSPHDKAVLPHRNNIKPQNSRTIVVAQHHCIHVNCLQLYRAAAGPGHANITLRSTRMLLLPERCHLRATRLRMRFTASYAGSNFSPQEAALRSISSVQCCRRRRAHQLNSPLLPLRCHRILLIPATTIRERAME